MNTLVVSDASSIADMFFCQEPIQTDWDCHLRQPELLDAGALIEKLKAREPILAHSPYEHELFVTQQLLRIAIRLRKNLPLVTDQVCADCGKRKTDPILKTCLYCAEFEQQIGHHGSRGSCFYVKPAYNPSTMGWGILYYNSHYHDDDFLFWIALGYGRWWEAAMALYPVTLYGNWQEVKFKGLTSTWRMSEHLFDMETVMKQEPPMNPAQFKKFMRAMIVESLAMEHSLASWAIRQALSDYESEMRK